MTPKTEKGLIRKNAAVAVVGLAIAAAAATVFLKPSAPVLADDASHTTGFASGGYDFDGSGAVPAAMATMTTTLPADDTWKIDIYRTPPGGSETLESFTSISRADGETQGCDLNLALAPYASGTIFRAHFETRSSSDVLIFSYDRYITKP